MTGLITTVRCVGEWRGRLVRLRKNAVALFVMGMYAI